MANYSEAQKTEWKSQKQDEVKNLLAKLETGVKALSSSDDWKSYLKSQSSFHKYSFRNVMLIMMQRPDATAVAGYRAWQAMGRQVKKGEKSIQILAPITKKFEVENDQGETEEHRRCFFRTVSVFDISQTDGPELPQTSLCTLLNGFDDEAEAIFELLREYAEKSLGYTVALESYPEPGLNGRCYFTEKRIGVSADRARLQQAKTLAHEIGHAILHSGEGGYEKIHSRPHMEVEAESFAYCLVNMFGLDTSDYSFGYVASWSSGDAKKIGESAKRIQGAVTKVLSHLEDMAEIKRLRAENAALKAAKAKTKGQAMADAPAALAA